MREGLLTTGKKVARKDERFKRAQITEFRVVPQPIRVTETDVNRGRKEREGSETRQETGLWQLLMLKLFTEVARMSQ